MYMRAVLEKEFANPSRLDLSEAEMAVRHQKQLELDSVNYAQWAANCEISRLTRIMQRHDGLKIALDFIREPGYLENLMKIYAVVEVHQPFACRMIRVWFLEMLKEIQRQAGARA